LQRQAGPRGRAAALPRPQIVTNGLSGELLPPEHRSAVKVQRDSGTTQVQTVLPVAPYQAQTNIAMAPEPVVLGVRHRI
jgi:hypothetical protein